MEVSYESVQQRFLEVFNEMASWPLFSRSVDLPSPFLRVSSDDGVRLLESDAFLDYQLELQNRKAAVLFDRILAAVGRPRVVEVRAAGVPPPAVKQRFDREISHAWGRVRAGERGEGTCIDCVSHTLIMLAQERGFGFALPEHASFERMGAACRAGYVPAVITKGKRVYPGRDMPELEVERWVAF